jgi:superfamily II DNA or RNA helicase
MIKLIVDNVCTHIQCNDNSLTPKLVNELYGKLSYTISEYVRFRKTIVEFDYSLLNKESLSYPTGLFSNVDEFCEKHNLLYNIIDKRHLPAKKEPLPIYDKKLRDYQSETVSKALDAERGIIKIATGGGKTLIAGAIIAELNLPTLFIVNSIDLLEQTYDVFKSILRHEVGRIGGGYCNILDINICTIQTLCNSLGIKYDPIDKEYTTKEKIGQNVLSKKQEISRLIENVDMIIIDETHHQRANSYVDLLSYAKNSYYKFGLSGTPYKFDSTDIILNAYMGREIINIDASFLIDRGYLVQPDIYFLDPNDLSEYTYLKGSFNSVYKKWIVNNRDRNNLILRSLERLLELDKITLITTTLIEHGELLLEMIQKELKVDAAFIKGEVKKERRKELLDLIRQRKLKVLIGTSLADEGLDLPALDAAIMSGGGKSLIKSLQRVGRTLRPYPSVEDNQKKNAIIIDFYDHLRYLTGQSMKRMQIYKKEKRFVVHKHF